VHMRVDQSRQQRHIAEVKHLQATRRACAVDRRHSGALDDHEREARMQPCTVVEPGGPDCPCPTVSVA
jgi:tellurite resistance protein